MSIGGFEDKAVSRAITSAVDSITKGISNANQTSGVEALKNAVSSFEISQTTDKFSSVAAQDFKRTGNIASPGHIKSPQRFFSELSSGKHQQAGGKRELAEKVLDPNLKLHSGIQGLEKTYQEETKKWEEKLNSIGDDAQLVNVDLQNILQKQQQTLQMMSNISKMLYDTASSVIRKMGG
jgi:hypothetical protein